MGAAHYETLGEELAEDRVPSRRSLQTLRHAALTWRVSSTEGKHVDTASRSRKSEHLLQKLADQGEGTNRARYPRRRHDRRLV
jgi:hypothetical protein